MAIPAVSFPEATACSLLRSLILSSYGLLFLQQIMGHRKQVATDARWLKLLQVEFRANAAGEGNGGDGEGMSGEEIGFGIAHHPGAGLLRREGQVFGDRRFEQVLLALGVVAIGRLAIVGAVDAAKQALEPVISQNLRGLTLTAQRHEHQSHALRVQPL